MKPSLERGLYVITDCRRLEFNEVLARTQVMLETGVAAVQYRDKNAATKTRITRAAQLHDLCNRYHTPLIINDDIETCLATGAEGLHIGSDDGDCDQVRQRLPADTILGLSCYNSLDKARAARSHGADYVAFGAFFPTDSKEQTVPASTALLKSAKQGLDIPVAAIGGITPENCRPLLEAGTDLVAVISAVYQAEDPAAEVRRFNELFQKVSKNPRS